MAKNARKKRNASTQIIDRWSEYTNLENTEKSYLREHHILQPEDTCAHPEGELIGVEYRGWYDGVAEWYCPSCTKRLTRDRKYTLHHEEMMCHPYYGVCNIRTKEWWIYVGIGAPPKDLSPTRIAETERSAHEHLRYYLTQTI